ncbi:MAG: hypothetical protein GC134_10050 [Proteobacteria bacterium]|nr:hypothetical protein [Pseudomonadota bacterium]
MSHSPKPDNGRETFRGKAREIFDDLKTGNTADLREDTRDIIDHAKEKLAAAWAWYTSKTLLGKVLWALPMLLLLPLGVLVVKFAAPILLVLVLIARFYLLIIRIIGIGGYLFYKVVKGLYINVLVATRSWKGTKAWLKRRAMAKGDPTMTSRWKDLEVTPAGGTTARIRFSYFRILFKGVTGFVKGFAHRAAYLPVLIGLIACGVLFFVTSYNVFVWTVTLVVPAAWALRKRVPGLLPWVNNHLPYIKDHQLTFAKHIFDPHKVGPYHDGRYIVVPADAVLKEATVNESGHTVVTVAYDHVESEAVQKFAVKLVKTWPFVQVTMPKKVKTPKTEVWTFTVTEHAESIPLWERVLTLVTVIPTALVAAYLFLGALHITHVPLSKLVLVLATMMAGNLFIFLAGWEPGRKK